MGIVAAQAQEPDRLAGRFKSSTIEQTEKSLIWALESDCPGMEDHPEIAPREYASVLQPDDEWLK